MAPRKYTCATCGKHYQQSSHLRRHERTHVETNAERLQCQYCSHVFARRDVWRRHMAHCPLNIHHDATPLAKRGQKPKACDHCFQRKIACDAHSPCNRCSLSKRICTYDRLVDSAGTVSEPAPVATPTEPRTEPTDPAQYSLPGPVVYTQGDFPTSLTDNIDLFLDDTFCPWMWIPPQYEDMEMQWPTMLADDSPASINSTEPVLLTIINDLHALHTKLVETEGSNTMTFDLDLAHRVFTSENRALLVGHYFRFTHREFPLTHRPSFDVDTISPGLLLAFFLCGSMYMAPAAGAKAPTPQVFLDLAEEYVFRNLKDMLGTRGPNGKVVETRQLYEALQAALLVHCSQYALPGATTRERNRTTRLPVLVSAVRSLGFLQVRHGGEEVPGWKDFVEQETRLRIGAWTLLSDWQQNGMFRLPSLMTISELMGDFPCRPSLWEAGTADEFDNLIAASGPSVWQRGWSIRQALETLMSDAPWPSIDKLPLRNPTNHDMYFLISAIHSVIGSADLMGMLPVTGKVLLRATMRWEQLWKEVASVSAQSGDKALDNGTISNRLSPEMCWLARKLVEGGMAGRFEDLEYFRGVAHYSLGPLHALIKKLKDL